jgi:arabinofuranosyltransferase
LILFVVVPSTMASDCAIATAAAGSRAESTTHRIVRWSLLAVPVIVLAEQAWARRSMSDDGFINLRVVSNIVHGNGPVFNVGERVEAATSPLWIFLLSIGDIVTPVRLEWIAVVLGIALSLIGVSLAVLGSRALLRDRRADELFVPVGALVLVAVAPVWTFSSTGLENGLAFAWLGASLWVLAAWSREEGRVSIPGAALIGLGPLIRPELGLYSALFLSVVLVGRRHEDTWSDRARVLAAALAVPVAYQVFRMGYYGSLVPNPALAKEASRARWGKGWDYLLDTVEPYVLWVPLALLAVGAYVPLVRDLRARGRTQPLLVAGAFVLGGLLQALYTIRVGGDFMHARLLLPSLFALVAPVAVVPLSKRYALSLLVVPWVIAGLFFLRAQVDDQGAFGTHLQNAVTLQDFGWQAGGPGRQWFRGDGVYYTTAKLPAEPVGGRQVEIASYGLGILSYAMGPDTYVLDLLGLGDAFTSHLALSQDGLVGHEKPLPAPWIAARITKPDAALAVSDFPFPGTFGARPLDHPRGVPFEQRERIARAALECPGVRDFLRSYSGSLTLGRFFGNFVDAVHNTRLRIPPEPADAYEKFCGRRVGHVATGG